MSTTPSAPKPPPAICMQTPEPTPVALSAGTQKEDNVFCFSTPWDLLFLCNECLVVNERTNFVELYWGKYHGTITEPGCYCRNGCAMELRRVSTNIHTYDLENTKVLDARGNPIDISGIITYEIVDSRKAALDVSNPHRYARCTVAGVRVEAFSINELSYAPEIAQAMLKRQQAEALIAARKTIADGAKDIAKAAVEDVGSEMDPGQKAALLSNLLVVLVGDKEVTPTLQV